jgi:ribosome maturation factor RimP
VGALPTFCLHNMDELENKIKTILSPDLHLMAVQENHQYETVRIVVDSEHNISIDEITDLTKNIRESEVIDKYYPDGYKLEVTSAGVTTNLEHAFQYRKNIGRKLKIKITDGDKIEVVKATLKDIDENGILIQETSKIRHINFAKIKQANVIVSFS